VRLCGLQRRSPGLLPAEVFLCLSLTPVNMQLEWVRSQHKDVNAGLPSIDLFSLPVPGGNPHERVRFAMDVDKLIEKVSRWLSDPKSREVIKSFIYVLLPLIVLSSSAMSNALSGKKQATAITPGFAAPDREPGRYETLQETMAKEKKKLNGSSRRSSVAGTVAHKARGAEPSPLTHPPRRACRIPWPGDDRAVREM